MFVGHFAVGLAAKRAEPTISLGTLVLASMMADPLWCIFMIAGIEHVQFKPGMGAANYLAASDIVMSHSLLMDGLWAGLLAAGYFSGPFLATGCSIGSATDRICRLRRVCTGISD